ncbi:DUF7341 domain-containing protein [Leucobacter sp. 1207-22]|uniref:DUF7341 domain-containing protein n=1 Tax=Leucobacter sp. 1207-22 TaxID=2604456 RepID=UPI004064BE58
METTERAVTRLTETHTVPVHDTFGECPPLLEMLREARYPNLGRTRGGGSGTGDMFDVKAVEMYETIDAGVRAWLNHYRQDSTGDLLDATKHLHSTLKAEEAGGRLNEAERMFAMFHTWVHRIEDHFDPPGEYELTGACPECGAEKIPEGEEPEPGQPDERPMKWAVRIQVKPGRAVIPECHACGKMWVTRADLTALAEGIKAEVEWVALQELTGEVVDIPVDSH